MYGNPNWHHTFVPTVLLDLSENCMSGTILGCILIRQSERMGEKGEENRGKEMVERKERKK